MAFQGSIKRTGTMLAIIYLSPSRKSDGGHPTDTQLINLTQTCLITDYVPLVIFKTFCTHLLEREFCRIILVTSGGMSEEFLFLNVDEG